MARLDFSNIRSQRDIDTIVQRLNEQYDPEKHVINAKTLRVEKKGGINRFWRIFQPKENYQVDKVAQSIIALQTASQRDLRSESGINRFYNQVDTASRINPSKTFSERYGSI